MAPADQPDHAAVRLRHVQVVAVDPHPGPIGSVGAAEPVAPFERRRIPAVAGRQPDRRKVRDLFIPEGPAAHAEFFEEFIYRIEGAARPVSGEDKVVAALLQQDFVRTEFPEIDAEQLRGPVAPAEQDRFARVGFVPDDRQFCAGDAFQHRLQLLCGCLFRQNRRLRQDDRIVGTPVFDQFRSRRRQYRQKERRQYHQLPFHDFSLYQ